MKIKCSAKNCTNEVRVDIVIRLCRSCGDRVVEKAAKAFAREFHPKLVGCSDCGHFFHWNEYPRHLPCWEELDADSKSDQV